MKALLHLIHAVKWSIAGITAAYRNQISFRIEVWAAVPLTFIACKIAPDLNQLLWMLFSVHLVLILELINSAIEAAIDRFGHRRTPLSRIAKDSGSAAVFYAIILATVVWLLIIFNR